MEDLVKGGLGQLHAHQQDQARYDQAGYVLDAAVAKGGVGVRLFARQTEAQQRHRRGAGVGQVVEGVRRDGDRARKRPRKQLEREEQQIDDNAHRSAKHTVSAPHCGIRRVLIVFDEPTRKKTDHSLPSLAFDL